MCTYVEEGETIRENLTKQTEKYYYYYKWHIFPLSFQLLIKRLNLQRIHTSVDENPQDKSNLEISQSDF